MICDDDINIANYIKSLIEKNYDENIKVNTYNTVDELEHSIFMKVILMYNYHFLNFSYFSDLK